MSAIALMEDITSELNASVLGSLGIEVVDVRVKRIDSAAGSQQSGIPTYDR